MKKKIKRSPDFVPIKCPEKLGSIAGGRGAVIYSATERHELVII